MMSEKMPHIRNMRSVLFRFCCVFLATQLPAAPPASGTIDGAPRETPYYIIESALPGPVVMIIGGMHGNEPAGAAAAEQIRHWTPARGKLIVIPLANPAARAANTRRIPGKPAAEGDLNRNFPRSEDNPDETRGPTATALWAFIRQHEPDWILDLHEGYDFHVRNSNSVGSSVIHLGSDPMTSALAERMLEVVNAEVDDPQRRFASLSRGPVDSGMVRAAVTHLGARGMILETTTRDQRLSHRVRQHRLMVYAFLRELEMVEHDANVVFPTRPPGHDHSPIRILIYDGDGANEAGIASMVQRVNDGGEAIVVMASPLDIRDGALNDADVVVFTGGRGGVQGDALGETGRQAVAAFIENGGGYIGICAGAYLATARLEQYLRLISTYHHRPWQIGTGMLEVSWTDAGRALFTPPANVATMRFANGPIFFQEDGLMPELDLPAFDIFATFASGVGDPETQQRMIGSPAIIGAPYGSGRVLLLSPHPESDPELTWLITAAIEWVSSRREALVPVIAD